MSRRLVLAALTAMLLILGVGTGTAGAQDTPPTPPVVPTMQVDNTVACGAVTDVVLTISGQNIVQTSSMVDLIWVIDASGSISSAQFNTAKNAIANVTSTLPGGTDEFRVGAVRFASGATLPSALTSPASAANAISGMATTTGGSTYTLDGLERAETELLANGRPGATKVIVLITDGQPNPSSQNPTDAYLKTLQVTRGWLMFAVGVGSGINTTNLNRFASDPNSDYAFPVADFDDLGTTLGSISTSITKPAGTGFTYSMEPAAGITLVPGSASADKGTVTPGATGFSWSLDSLATESVTISYQLQHIGGTDGVLRLHGTAALVWTQDGTPQSTSYTSETVEVVDCDTTAPVTTATINGTAGDNGWYTALNSVTLNAVDEVDGSGVASITWSASGANTDGGTTSGDTVALGLPNEGITTLTFFATDNAGNKEAPRTLELKVDGTAPAIASVNAITEEATGPGGAIVTYTAPATRDAIAGDGTATCLPASGSMFTLGDTTVACIASDIAGNTSSSSFTVSVVDTTAPTLTSVGSQIVEATSAAGATVSFTAPTASDLVDGAVAVTCGPASGSTFAITTTTVTCTATDSRNNASSTTFTVTVQDTTAPVISPMPDIDVAYAGSTSTLVNYTAPATSDAVDGAGVASCSPASGSAFLVGSTTVTCTATDAAGNAASPVTFAVSVGYEWSGFMSPFDSSKAIKAGSTLPLKFRLTGASAGITTLTPKVYVAPVVGGVAGAEQAAISSNGATAFEYKDGQYQFNWKTTGLTAGTYQLRLDLGDGISHTVLVTLR